MKTIKVIDLLNKIAKGEEVPKKIKWGAHEFEWFVYEYKAKGEFQEPTLLEYLSQAPSMLNEEVEIIEEPQEHKIPKKFKVNWELDDDNTIDLEVAGNIECKLADKINEIIDYLEEIE